MNSFNDNFKTTQYGFLIPVVICVSVRELSKSVTCHLENDTLEAGPNLLPEIVGCLLRFRKHEFAVTCDGKQAFLQLILHEKDREFTRYRWYKLEFDSSGTPYFTDEIAVYRFSRLPFGLTCSPFLLCASTRELAMKHISEFPIAASMIDKHLYMDDFLASTETETHITMLYHEITDLMTLMKLPMEKWATNSLKLKDVIQTNKEFHKSTTAVLGIDWDTNDDTLGNAFKKSFCVAGGKPLTKRWLLRSIASCYDPLGLFSPFTIIGKILFQDTWILGIKWDELLPTNLSTMWYAAVKQLDDICSIKISRYIGISSHSPYSVHVFCDASERAYGSVLYIVTSQSNVHIVCSRNRLAPIKKVTLPRLELLAALMGTRLLKYFCKEVDIQPSAATLWTAYIALFICATTRALLLELVSDLSTDKFLLALQRFVGRRGLPCTIYTDNATTFHAANKELIHLWKVITSGKIQQFYAHNGIHWKFIVPRAAWWGGWLVHAIALKFNQESFESDQCRRIYLGHKTVSTIALFADSTDGGTICHLLCRRFVGK
ncbi:integrase catalytic domain-containing protein, partial [Nephila pilipes]